MYNDHYFSAHELIRNTEDITYLGTTTFDRFQKNFMILWSIVMRL